MAMKIAAWIALAIAPTIATAEAAAKPPPACVAVDFPPLPPGTTAGDHQVSVYNSPPMRLELRGNFGGAITNYYMLIDGKRIEEGEVPASMTGTATHQGYRLPPVAAKCLAAKNLPKPQCIRSASPSMAGMCLGDCQGEGLMVVVAPAARAALSALSEE